MNPLVITGCSQRFEAPFVKSFLPTLRREGAYTGDILFVDFGVSPRAQKALFKECRHVISAPEGANHLIRSNLSYWVVASFLRQNREYTHVLNVDAGDIWFQGPIEDLWRLVQDSIGGVCEEQTCASPWFIEQVNKLPPLMRGEVKKRLGERRVVNCGMLAGPASQVDCLFADTHHRIAESGLDQFAGGQVWLNYLLLRGLYAFTELPRRFNFIPQCFQWKEREGKLVECETDQPATICHNAGHRLFPRMVDGEDLNIVNEFNKAS